MKAGQRVCLDGLFHRSWDVKGRRLHNKFGDIFLYTKRTTRKVKPPNFRCCFCFSGLMTFFIKKLTSSRLKPCYGSRILCFLPNVTPVCTVSATSSHTHKKQPTPCIFKLLWSVALTTSLGYLYDCNAPSMRVAVWFKKSSWPSRSTIGAWPSRVDKWAAGAPGAPCGDRRSHFKTSWLSAGGRLNNLCTSSRTQWPARYWGGSDYNNTVSFPFPHLHTCNFLFLGDIASGKFIIFASLEICVEVRCQGRLQSSAPWSVSLNGTLTGAQKQDHQIKGHSSQQTDLPASRFS